MEETDRRLLTEKLPLPSPIFDLLECWVIGYELAARSNM
jgi:hypothetical protein